MNAYDLRNIRIASMNEDESSEESESFSEDPKELSKQERIQAIKDAYNSVRDSIHEDMSRCLVPLPKRQIKIPKDTSFFDQVESQSMTINDKSIKKMFGSTHKALSHISSSDFKNACSAIKKVFGGELKVTKEEYYSLKKQGLYAAMSLIWSSTSGEYSRSQECSDFFKYVINNILSVSKVVITKYSLDGTEEGYFGGCVSDSSRSKRKNFFSKLFGK